MKSITIKQPWAWAIMHGKRTENRAWERAYRGPLAIHAGKGWDRDGENSPLVQRVWRDAGHDVYWLDGDHKAITLGAVVAVAELVDICTALNVCDCGSWAAANQYHWRLADVRPLAEPIPCKGALGLWTLPDQVEAAVVAQLGERANA